MPEDYLSLPPTRQDLTQGQKPEGRLKWGWGGGKVGNKSRLEPCWSVLLIGSLGAMWAWWGKQFHEPKCGSGHICRVMAWTRHQGLVPYIGSWERLEARGASGIIITSEEMDRVTWVQNLYKADCISHSTNILGKGMNPTLLPMGKIVGQSGLFILAIATSFGKGKIKICSALLKYWPCVTSCLCGWVGKYTYIYNHHDDVLLAWISLTHSRNSFQSSIAPDRSSRLHSVSVQSCCR